MLKASGKVAWWYWLWALSRQNYELDLVVLGFLLLRFSPELPCVLASGSAWPFFPVSFLMILLFSEQTLPSCINGLLVSLESSLIHAGEAVELAGALADKSF